MELLKKLVEYTSKDGSKKKTYNLYLKLNNGDLVAIKPAYQGAKDYYKLTAIATDLNHLVNDKDLPF